MTQPTDKHTPGPWTANQHMFGPIFIEDESAMHPLRDIAEVKARSNAEANARLIAAAPDLLEACKEFVRKCEAGEARSKQSYDQMKAAIVKAEDGS